MKLGFTPRAYIDRELIFSYLDTRSPDGAKAVMKRLQQAIEHLKIQPLDGRLTDIEGVRVLFVGKYPYKIFYSVDDQTLTILHIRHTAQQTIGFKHVA